MTTRVRDGLICVLTGKGAAWCDLAYESKNICKVYSNKKLITGQDFY